MDERRTNSRIDFAGKAYLTYNGRCRCDDVVDVSAEGLALRTDARLKPGKEVKVFLPVPRGEGYRLCLLKGEVVRRDGKRRGERLLGIAFAPGAVDTRGLLAEYVAAQA